METISDNVRVATGLTTQFQFGLKIANLIGHPQRVLIRECKGDVRHLLFYLLGNSYIWRSNCLKKLLQLKHFVARMDKRVVQNMTQVRLNTFRCQRVKHAQSCVRCRGVLFHKLFEEADLFAILFGRDTSVSRASLSGSKLGAIPVPRMYASYSVSYCSSLVFARVSSCLMRRRAALG